ncbi:MAG: hypothetical protein IH986_15335 [Planctomycetes bacterium]|nr:hypothetical protein [Planctomycetota bacterium]
MAEIDEKERLRLAVVLIRDIADGLEDGSFKLDTCRFHSVIVEREPTKDEDPGWKYTRDTGNRVLEVAMFTKLKSDPKPEPAVVS